MALNGRWNFNLTNLELRKMCESRKRQNHWAVNELQETGYYLGHIQRNHLQPVRPILFHKFSNFYIFILGSPILITPEREGWKWENGMLESSLFPIFWPLFVPFSFDKTAEPISGTHLCDLHSVRRGHRHRCREGHHRRSRRSRHLRGPPRPGIRRQQSLNLNNILELYLRASRSVSNFLG